METKDWTVEWEKLARKAFNKLDARLRTQIEQHLQKIILAPTATGHGLTGDTKSGQWSYEVTKNYRIVCDLLTPEGIILIKEVGDHKATYGKQPKDYSKFLQKKTTKKFSKEKHAE